MQSASSNKPIRILRWPEVGERVGICRSYAHALAAKGQFPKPIKLGIRASAWVESEIDEWLRDRIEQSRDNDDIRGGRQ
jgi:prophage regulatory protein